LNTNAWLLDIGNTRIKWCSVDRGVYKTGSVLRYTDFSLSELIQSMQDISGRPDKVYLASVASTKFVQDLREKLIESFNIAPLLIISKHKEAGIVNGYDEPEKLGVDRWLAIIAAYNLEQSCVIVVDAGTALTVDYVDSKGQHHGGLIAPGLTMMRQMLMNKTARIEFNLNSQKGFTGHTVETNTQDAISSGTLRMMASFINAEVERLSRSSEDKVKLYLTGGDAQLLLQLLDDDWVYEPNLVLLGMYHVVSELPSEEIKCDLAAD